jgi:hypothetical protein
MEKKEGRKKKKRKEYVSRGIEFFTKGQDIPMGRLGWVRCWRGQRVADYYYLEIHFFVAHKSSVN